MNWNVSPKKNPEIVLAMKGYPNWLNIQRNEEDGTPKDRALWMLKWTPPMYPKPDDDTIDRIISSLKHPVSVVIREARKHHWGISVFIHSPKQLDVTLATVGEQLNLATMTGSRKTQLYLPRIAMVYVQERNVLRLTGDTRALNVFILNNHFIGATLQDGEVGKRACDVAISSQADLESKVADVQELCEEFGWKADMPTPTDQCERSCVPAARAHSSCSSALPEDHNSPPATPPRSGKETMRKDKTEKETKASPDSVMNVCSSVSASRLLHAGFIRQELTCCWMSPKCNCMEEDDCCGCRGDWDKCAENPMNYWGAPYGQEDSDVETVHDQIVPVNPHVVKCPVGCVCTSCCWRWLA